jgi:metal-responsive CopG/Arc/MetJ family transcriptional regulator
MSTLDSAKKPKGRPRADTEAVNVRLPREVIARLDAYRKEERDLPTRPEAIRRLVEKGLVS